MSAAPRLRRCLTAILASLAVTALPASADNLTITLDGSPADSAHLYTGPDIGLSDAIYVPGGNSPSANGNTVTVDGPVTGHVLGGLAGNNSFTGNAASSGSTVKVTGSGSVSGCLIGGYAFNIGSGTAIASGNHVILNSGATGQRELHGGFARSLFGAAIANNNTVDFSGAYNGNLYLTGGFAQSNTPDAAHSAAGNTITIREDATFTNAGGASLYGGYIQVSGAESNQGDAFTGNTLNIDNWTTGKNSSAAFNQILNSNKINVYR